MFLLYSKRGWLESRWIYVYSAPSVSQRRNLYPTFSPSEVVSSVRGKFLYSSFWKRRSTPVVTNEFHAWVHVAPVMELRMKVPMPEDSVVWRALNTSNFE